VRAFVACQLHWEGAYAVIHSFSRQIHKEMSVDGRLWIGDIVTVGGKELMVLVGIIYKQ
jgi:hypothetical protein